MIHRRSTAHLDLAALERARQRRAENAAELRALLDEMAESDARKAEAAPAPSSPGLLTLWARKALERDRERRAAASPCPLLEEHHRALANAGPWEVEPESGPVTLRPSLLALGMWALE